VGVEVGVGLLLRPIDKANNAYEVGEVGVVEQVGKVRPELRSEEEDKGKIGKSRN
jgi:hypothetical protein